jgi:hypothetical protein
MSTLTVKITSYSTLTIDYSVIQSPTATQVRFGSCTFKNTRSGGLTASVRLSVDISEIISASATSYTQEGYTWSKLPKGTKTKTGLDLNVTRSITKTRSAITGRGIKVDVNMESSDDYWSSTTRTISVTVPAKASYAVTYDAAGGSGAPAKQTKWHGESLRLQTGVPTRLGYIFWKWNTAADGTGASWSPGASYNANAPLALHAIWNFTPRITALKAYRCDAQGNQDDSGTYAWVEAVWECDGTRSGNTGNVTAKITAGGTESSVTVGGDASGTGGTMTALIPSVDVDTQYTIAVTVTDTLGTVTRGAILTTSHFTMDVYRGGSGFGIGCSAPGNGFAIGYDVDFRAGFSCAGRTALPAYLYSSQPALADVPRVPCLVVLTSGAHYLYTSGGIKTL